MIVRIIQSLISGKSNEVVQEEAIKDARKNKETPLIDVAQEALRKKAASDRADLEGIVKYGWPHVKREKFKCKTRKKVWDTVSQAIGTSDDDMVDEITERIVDVAEVDPYYREIFKEEAE